MGRLPAHELFMAGLIVVGAVYGVLANSRMAAIVSIGGSGIGLALLFAMYGSVDLAITQLMVETLMVIVLVLVILRMPAYTKRSGTAGRLRDAVVAIAGGATVTMLVLASASVEMPADVAAYFLDAAVPEGYGRNVVNVILVDFRALDTLGEIVVVAVAGLGVAALVWLGKPRPATRGEGGTA